MTDTARWIRFGRIVLAACAVAGSARAAGGPDSGADAFRRRVEIGARIGAFRLRDRRRSGPRGYDNRNLQVNYIGSVWGLDEEQDSLPRPFIRLLLGPYGGFGLGFDRIRASTVDWGDEEKSYRATDGDLVIQGPMVFGFARFPNASAWTPFAEAGFVFYRADFRADPEWLAHSPGRRFTAGDTSGVTLALGCDYALGDRWAASAFWRWQRGANAEATAYFPPYRPRSGSFPMDYNMAGIGLYYSF